MEKINADDKGDEAAQNFVLDKSIPQPDATKMANSVLCLIRHGTTEFNVVCQRVLKTYGADSEEFRKLKIDKELIDPPLNDIGLAQCQLGTKYVNDVDFKVVYVSPMYRTLMTTSEMFKEHPNKDSIKFVVLPSAKEGLHLCNDICGPFKRVYDIYSNPDNCFGIKYDFSYVHSYGRESTWQFNLVSDLTMLQTSYETLKYDKIDEKTFDVDQSNDHFLEEVYNQFPLRAEGYGVLYWRTELVKKFIKEHLKHNITLGKDQKAAVVAHSSFLKCITATGVAEDGEVIAGADMANCEIYPFVDFQI